MGAPGGAASEAIGRTMVMASKQTDAMRSGMVTGDEVERAAMLLADLTAKWSHASKRNLDRSCALRRWLRQAAELF